MLKYKTKDKVKYRRNLTIAPLDLCLKKDLITEEHYKAAIFFGFLYRIRYGSQVRVNNSYSVFLKISGMSPSSIIYDEACLTRYSNIYHQMVSLLKKNKSFDMVCDICVFDITPGFLRATPKNTNYINQAFSEYRLFRDGLSELAKYLNNKNYLSH